MEPVLFGWAVLEATVNGRSFVGMPGVELYALLMLRMNGREKGAGT
jgi:hypothetical protein